MDTHFDGGLHNSSIKVQCAVAELYSCASHLQIKTMGSLFLVVLQLFIVVQLAVGARFSLPNCTDHCGNVPIPYPFGIGANCYHDRSYEIICNVSSGSPKPFLREFNLEVLDINWPGRYSNLDTRSRQNGQIVTVSLPRPNLCGSDGGKKIRSNDLRGSPYRFSMAANVLMLEGCGGSAVLKQRNGEILAECASACASNAFNMTGAACNGVGCCQASMPHSNENDYSPWRGDIDIYEIDIVFEHLMKMKSNSCNASVALIDSGSVHDFTGSLSSLEFIPTALQWKAINMPPLPYAYGKKAKGANATCYDPDYGCNCGYPYEGNPYMPYGCQVVEECRKCENRCDYGWNPTNARQVYYCRQHSRQAPFLGFSIGMGVVVLILGSYWLYRFIKRRREIKRKASHFKRNGGLLLQQQVSSNEGLVETTKIFTVVELEKATDNFNENRVIGQGGQGTVYKGMLIDGKIVAIKKAKKVDESQVEQFVNEVVILSQINHRNVVKLLGCCLETEVPILVYEFIPNGTLYEHIHGQSVDFHVSWKMRLQIAAESAGAVAYLHSSSSAPIYHRDIKTTNILLDEKYRAKVSDFGTSKAINIEQTHVTTVVLGTYGYLDPEYFQSSQFTEKSDVYSFGVVLVELITGKKPICPTGNGGWISLATEFLTQMEASRLFDMLDSRIIDEGKEHEFMGVAELARKCLNVNGKQRPTMKEIGVCLDGIRSSHIPILKEVRPANSNQAVTEVIHSDGGPVTELLYSDGNPVTEVMCSDGSPFCTGVFSPDDETLACSIEIQPLMASI